MKIFEKFSEFVMALKADKWWHIMAGVVLFALCLYALPIDDDNMIYSTSLGVVAVIAATKEIVWDMLLKKGTPEWNDFLATMVIPTVITALQFLISL